VVASHQSGQHQGRVTTRLLPQLLGRTPSSPNGRIRNCVANEHLGAAQTVIHENILSPGAKVPPHSHEVEEVIVVLEEHGKCHRSAGIEAYRTGE